MMDYCVRESTINRDELPIRSGEEVRNPRHEQTIAVYADKTANALKEANLTLDRLFENVFGPQADKANEAPRPPIGCLEHQMAQNAEMAFLMMNRIAELVNRMFG